MSSICSSGCRFSTFQPWTPPAVSVGTPNPNKLIEPIMRQHLNIYVFSFTPFAGAKTCLRAVPTSTTRGHDPARAREIAASVAFLFFFLSRAARAIGSSFLKKVFHRTQWHRTGLLVMHLKEPRGWKKGWKLFDAKLPNLSSARGSERKPFGALHPSGRPAGLPPDLGSHFDFWVPERESPLERFKVNPWESLKSCTNFL